jgi:hypothetical protein
MAVQPVFLQFSWRCWAPRQRCALQPLCCRSVSRRWLGVLRVAALTAAPPAPWLIQVELTVLLASGTLLAWISSLRDAQGQWLATRLRPGPLRCHDPKQAWGAVRVQDLHLPGRHCRLPSPGSRPGCCGWKPPWSLVWWLRWPWLPVQHFWPRQRAHSARPAITTATSTEGCSLGPGRSIRCGAKHANPARPRSPLHRVCFPFLCGCNSGTLCWPWEAPCWYTASAGVQPLRRCCRCPVPAKVGAGEMACGLLPSSPSSHRRARACGAQS